MSDTTVTTEAPVLDLPKEPVLNNSTEARLPDGTLKDQSTSLAGTTTTPTEPKTPEGEVKPVVPEAYADFKLADGQTLNPDTLKEASAVFKELGLTQDQAQKLVDFYGKDMTKTLGAPQTAFNDMVSGWRADVLKDSTLASGDGLRTDVRENIGKLKASLPADQRASFDEVMNLSGLGNHPTIVKALNSWGKSLSEGKHVAGNGPSPEGQKAPGSKGPVNIAKAMFPNLS
jgi:hypothetical protein